MLVTKTLRFPPELWEAIEAKAGKRHAAQYVREAVEQRMEREAQEAGLREAVGLTARVAELEEEVRRLRGHPQ